MLKKTVSALACTALLLSSLTTVGFAKNDKVTEKELDKYLVKAGYPQEVIAELELPQKENLYKEDAVYTYHKKTYGNIKEKDNKGRTTENLLDNTDGANIQSLANWTSTLVASQDTTPSVTGKVEFVMDYNWTWAYDPYFSFEDKFGMAWTDDFDPYPSTAVYAYRTFGKEPNSGALTEKTTGNVYTYDNYLPGAGIGWKYDILDYYYVGSTQYLTYKHKGWGEVKIGKYSNKSGLSESTSAVATYFHKEGTVEGTLTFSPTPSVGISWATQYDRSPDVGTVFNWTNYKY